MTAAELVKKFDDAAMAWGWEQDQGSRHSADVAKRDYDKQKAKVDRLAELLDAWMAERANILAGYDARRAQAKEATDRQIELMKGFWGHYGEPPHVRPLNATLLKKDFLSLIARIERGESETATLRRLLTEQTATYRAQLDKLTAKVAFARDNLGLISCKSCGGPKIEGYLCQSCRQDDGDTVEEL